MHQASDANDPNGHYQLGNCYSNGFGVKQNDKRAVSYFQKASDMGLAIAHCNLGILYENGRGVAKDEKRAAALYRQAADSGLARAQYFMGQVRLLQRRFLSLSRRNWPCKIATASLRLASTCIYFPLTLL